MAKLIIPAINAKSHPGEQAEQGTWWFGVKLSVISGGFLARPPLADATRLLGGAAPQRGGAATPEGLPLPPPTTCTTALLGRKRLPSLLLLPLNLMARLHGRCWCDGSCDHHRFWGSSRRGLGSRGSVELSNLQETVQAGVGIHSQLAHAALWGSQVTPSSWRSRC